MSTFSDDLVSAISDEIDEFMKQSGVFDDMRENLRDGIFNNSEFRDCIRDYKEECKLFCERSDLTEARNILRAKLSSYLDTRTESGLKIRELVHELIKQRSDYIRDTYNTHAIEYLKKFLPNHFELLEEDMDVEESSPPPRSPPFVSPAHNDVHHSPVETPTYVPSPNPPLTSPAYVPSATPPSTSPVHNSTNYFPDKQSTEPGVQEDDPLAPLFSPISDKESDELEKLTFSSVSSVKTADLSDFDNSINLSDDEADIVGKPANSKVPVSIVADRITNLNSAPEDTSNDITGRRASRTRKPNHKYSSEHFKLL